MRDLARALPNQHEVSKIEVKFAEDLRQRLDDEQRRGFAAWLLGGAASQVIPPRRQRYYSLQADEFSAAGSSKVARKN
jgi:hypothetical protein